MSATTAPAPTLDVTSTSRVPFSRLVQVELRKSYDTRAGRWLLYAIAALVVIAEGIVLAIVVVNDESASWGDFVGIAAFVTSILLPVLGILLVTAEWGQRTAMVTFTLEPRRPLVLLAKLVVGFVLTLATVVVAIVVGLVCNVLYIAFQGSGSWEFGWNYLVGFVLSQSLAMIGGFALAALLLNTPAAIVVFFVYRYVVPGLLFTGAALVDWISHVAPYVNLIDAQGPLQDLSMDTGEEWAHFLVATTIWVVLPLVIGLRRILRAEVK